MSRPIEISLTMLCLMYDWSAEARNASTGMSASFAAEAQAHATQHEQRAVEMVRRVRVYGANYVEPAPVPREGRAAAARRDMGMQTGLLDRTRRLDHRERYNQRYSLRGVDDERILPEVPDVPGDAAVRGGNAEEREDGYSWQVWRVRNDDVQDG